MGTHRSSYTTTTPSEPSLSALAGNLEVDVEDGM